MLANGFGGCGTTNNSCGCGCGNTVTRNDCDCGCGCGCGSGWGWGFGCGNNFVEELINFFVLIIVLESVLSLFGNFLP